VSRGLACDQLGASVTIYLWRIVLLILPLVIGGTVAGFAQSDDLDALKARVIELSDARKHNEAIALAERHAEMIVARHGGEHPEYATALVTLARLLQETDRPTEAEPLLRGALAIDEKRFGPDDPIVAADLNNLGVLLLDSNRLPEAEPLLRRAFTINEKSLGSDDPGVAINLSNLGVLLLDMNRLAEAEPMLRRALAIDEKSFAPDHPTVAVDLTNLARLFKASNRLAEAEEIHRRILTLDKKNSGKPASAKGDGKKAGPKPRPQKSPGWEVEIWKTQ
jgi:tetratricopeptide (TPR) repeat protein